MISYGKQSIDQSDINVVVDVLRSDFLTQGPKVIEFEKKLAQYCGAKYAVACANGTAALHLAYLVAGIKAGDEVITTPNTFVATSNMLMAIGAKPKFCDIRLDTYNIDEKKIEKLITKKTKAIVPVHFAGQSCEMDKINLLAKKYKLFVIEDACHALGAKYKKNKVGSCQYADMSIMSFHPVKPITTGEGGAILTNNKSYYQKLQSLRSHGIHKNKSGKNVMTQLGFNYRLTDIQSALGISQLKRLDKFIQQRRQVVSWYKKELADISDIIIPIELNYNYSGWHLYVIRTKKASHRDKLAKYLKDNGIRANFHYPAVYSHPYYRQNGYKNIRLTNEEIYDSTCITLPCYPALKREEVKYIAKAIKDFFKV
ncbi:MAG: UDP-4-amino-4,6-dideoxy-N-acetyl-beta-L-altrosamine transaminase [Candidatus Kuenenbacteria bacterium]